MDCASCARTIENAVLKISGVSSAQVNFASQTLLVEFDETKTSIKDIEKGILVANLGLSVVVDDAAQGITDVVRGADLLYSTPRQIYLQKLMGLKTPAYMHLPVVVNAQGEKLSKQTLARPVGINNAASTLFDALVFLRQQPPAELRLNKIEPILAWAIANWQPNSLLNCHQLTVE